MVHKKYQKKSLEFVQYSSEVYLNYFPLLIQFAAHEPHSTVHPFFFFFHILAILLMPTSLISPSIPDLKVTTPSPQENSIVP